MFFFFFSSRRRHTRLTCDWSSDVCSSDLHGGTTRNEHVIKLNYTSLQHAVEPVEVPLAGEGGAGASSPPVLVLPLHGHLAPACWAAAQVSPRLRVGYVQTVGGALPGSLS